VFASYVAATLVGPKGKVTGVDMLDDMLIFARKYIPSFTSNLGYTPDLSFVKGHIEDLQAAGVPKESADVCISNCVVNLVRDKRAVLTSVYNTLREGGEFYFSDMYTDQRLPKWLTDDNQLVAEHLGGAMYYRDFVKLAKEVGFKDPRVMSVTRARVNTDVLDKLSGVTFLSVTFRLFKCSKLQPSREKYGDTATYKGTIPGSNSSLKFDFSHTFLKDKPLHVDRNTMLMLRDGWIAKNFSVSLGPLDAHGDEIHEGPSYTAVLEDDVQNLLKCK